MKTIIIGASRGIGQYLFSDLREQGYDVIGTYSKHFIDGPNYFHLDILNEDSVSDFAESYKGEKIVLICCAGTTYNSYAHKADLNKWKEVIDVNVVVTFNVLHAFLQNMRDVEWGRIMLFSSVVTKVPTPGVSAYAASKAAINSMVKSLAIENASKGITVNSINLGYTNAGMGVNDVPEKFKSEILERIPAHRFCEHNEIANLISYFMHTPYANGSCVDLNGGLI